MLEDMADEGIYGTGAVALIPVSAVANNNTQLGFALSLINGVIGAVANVLAIRGLYGEALSVWGRVTELPDILCQVVLEADTQRRGGVKLSELLVYFPGIINGGIGKSLFAESDLIASSHTTSIVLKSEGFPTL